MNNEARRRRLDEIGDGVLARAGRERETFVATACLGGTLRAEVDALLTHGDGAEREWMSTGPRWFPLHL